MPSTFFSTAKGVIPVNDGRVVAWMVAVLQRVTPSLRERLQVSWEVEIAHSPRGMLSLHLDVLDGEQLSELDAIASSLKPNTTVTRRELQQVTSGDETIWLADVELADAAELLAQHIRHHLANP